MDERPQLEDYVRELVSEIAEYGSSRQYIGTQGDRDTLEEYAQAVMKVWNLMREYYAGVLVEVDQLREQLRDYDQTHMALPLDADGVPIRVGDTLRYVDFNIQAAAVSPERVYYWDEVPHGHWVKGASCRHVKPRTLEDVLRELAETVRDSDGFNDACIDAVADEIRELMEVDE